MIILLYKPNKNCFYTHVDHHQSPYHDDDFEWHCVVVDSTTTLTTTPVLYFDIPCVGMRIELEWWLWILSWDCVKIVHKTNLSVYFGINTPWSTIHTVLRWLLWTTPFHLQSVFDVIDLHHEIVEILCYRSNIRYHLSPVFYVRLWLLCHIHTFLNTPLSSSLPTLLNNTILHNVLWNFSFVYFQPFKASKQSASSYD